MGKLFYKPAIGVSGDYIPFYKEGSYHLFYLLDYRDKENHGEGTPWFQVVSKDFLSFDDKGEMLPRGSADEQDLYVFTGSVIQAGSTYHIFYTGHNHHLRERALPMQGIMHAVSGDLLRWTKLPEDTFYSDAGRYEPDDFRDPFVFYDGNTGRYQMLVVCRIKDAGYLAGVTAIYSSSDLKTWRNDGDFWAPGLYHTHECPDLFRMGDWWYLIYSEYSDRRQTRYVMARKINGPWIIPDDDAFDDSVYYAAKTAGDGKSRYLFGWVSTREGDNDENPLQWGDCLAVHELVQRADGTLGCRLPETINRAWSVRQELEAAVTISNIGGRSDALLFSGAGLCWRFDARLRFSEGTHLFGITLGQSFTEKHDYKFEFAPHDGRVSFGSVTRPDKSCHTSRPVALQAETELPVTILCEDDVCVLYCGDGVALCNRMYDRKGEDIAVFVVGGECTVLSAAVSDFIAQ